MLSRVPVVVQSLGRMVAVLRWPPVLGSCRKFVYRLHVPGLRFPIPPSRVWEANVFLLLC